MYEYIKLSSSPPHSPNPSLQSTTLTLHEYTATLFDFQSFCKFLKMCRMMAQTLKQMLRGQFAGKWQWSEVKLYLCLPLLRKSWVKFPVGSWTLGSASEDSPRLDSGNCTQLTKIINTQAAKSSVTLEKENNMESEVPG